MHKKQEKSRLKPQGGLEREQEARPKNMNLIYWNLVSGRTAFILSIQIILTLA